MVLRSALCFYGMGNVLTPFANIFSGVVFLHTETCLKKNSLLSPFKEGLYPSAFLSQHTGRHIPASSLPPFYARTLEGSQTRWGFCHLPHRRRRRTVCSAERLNALCVIFSWSLSQHELNRKHRRAAANRCLRSSGAKCPGGPRSWRHLYGSSRSPLHSLSSPGIRSESGHHTLCPHRVPAMMGGIVTTRESH